MEFKLQQNSYNSLLESVLNEDSPDYIKECARILLDAGVPNNKVAEVLTKIIKLVQGGKEDTSNNSSDSSNDKWGFESGLRIQSISYTHRFNYKSFPPFLEPGTSKKVYWWIESDYRGRESYDAVVMDKDGNIQKAFIQNKLNELIDDYTKYVYPRAHITLKNKGQLGLVKKGIKVIKFGGTEWHVLPDGSLLQKYAMPKTERPWPKKFEYYLAKKLEDANVKDGEEVPFTVVEG